MLFLQEEMKLALSRIRKLVKADMVDYLGIILVSLPVLYCISWLSAWIFYPAFNFKYGDCSLTSKEIKYMQLLSDKSDDFSFHAGFAGLMLKQGRSDCIDIAIKEYEKAGLLSPQEPSVNIGLIHAYFKKWEFHKNIEEYTPGYFKHPGAGVMITAEKVVDVIDKASDKEGNNAFYDYFKGWILINKGIAHKERKQRLFESEYEYERESEIRIKDDEFVKRGVDAILKGNEKQYYDSLDDVIVQQAIAFLPEAGKDVNPLAKIEISSKIEFYFPLAIIDNSIQAMTCLSRMYEDDGEYEKAEEMLKAIGEMGRKIVRRARTLIRFTEGLSILDAGDEALRDYCKRRGMIEEAAAYEDKKKDRDNFYKSCRSKTWPDSMKYGIIDGVIARPDIMIDYDTSTENNAQYAQLEVLVNGVAFNGMLFLVFAAIIVWSFTRYRMKKYEVFHFKNVRWGMWDYTLILGGGLMAPLIFFLIFNRWHLSRQYGIGHTGYVWTVQTGLIPIIIAVLILFFTGLRLRYKMGWSDGQGGMKYIILKRYCMLVFLIPAFCLAFFWLGPYRRTSYVIWTLCANPEAALILTGVGWIKTVQAGKLAGKLEEVYRRRIMFCKSLVLFLCVAMIVLVVFNLTVTKGYFKETERVYEIRVIDRFIDDEVGATRLKDLRDFAGWKQ
ncbi:MAG: hypothetical protein HZA48_07565 [Planctomycetes bacterium]|nr:hypothetical protein [Planctomycetota bacterium]